MLLYFAAKILHEEQVQNKTVLFAGGALALAGSFGVSLAPFLVSGFLALLYFARSKVRWRHVMIFLVVVFVGMIPSFIYNFVRMGSPLRPATTASQYDVVNALMGNPVLALFGLTFSPNRGIFLFAPILLLLFVFPFVWKKLNIPARHLILSFGISAVLYILLISTLINWGAFGWGPRYLLPILPILFLGVAMTLVPLWDRYKYPLMGLILVSFVLNAAPVLVNWDLASTPQAVDPYALLPRQHMAVWNGLYLATQGQPLPAPAAIADDPIRGAGARFPDLWTIRVMERPALGFFAGLVTSLMLLAVSLACLMRLLTKRELNRSGKA